MAGDVPIADAMDDDAKRVADDLDEQLGVIEMREDDNDLASGAMDLGRRADEQLDAPARQANVERITRPWLTKYERTRILGTRATQIAMGAAPTVECPDETDPLRIAEKELLEFRVPLVVRRYLPDGSFEDWKVSEMDPQRQSELRAAAP